MLIIEGPLNGQKMASYEFHKDLVAFRPPALQHKALIEIADLPEGRISYSALKIHTIVGYVTYLYPDPLRGAR